MPQQVISTNQNSKYLLVLKICNIIMTSAGYHPIDDLENFKNINKNLMISPEVKKQIDDLFNDIAELFPTFVEKYNSPKTNNNYISMLRSMCKEIGYSLKQKRQVIVHIIPNTKKKKPKKPIKRKEFGECIYSIKKKSINN